MRCLLGAVDGSAVASVAVQESKPGAKILTGAVSAAIPAGCEDRDLLEGLPYCVTEYAIRPFVGFAA
jgi:hypothetical protein